jgi:nucleoside 2-deoxyribosyltransferase
METQVKAYLAHTFKHRKFIKEVLTPKINALGIKTKNPFYETDGTTKRKEVALADQTDCQGLSTSDIAKQSPQDKEKEKWIQMVRANNKLIVQRDLHFINTTDLTIAYLTEISAGTCCEIFWTGVVKKRAVFLLTDNPEVFMHPWIIYSCRKGKICKTMDELLRALKRRYG